MSKTTHASSLLPHSSLAQVVEWQTRTLEVRMLTRLAGSTPVLGMEKFDKVRKWPRLLPNAETAGLFLAAFVSLCYNKMRDEG